MEGVSLIQNHTFPHLTIHTLGRHALTHRDRFPVLNADAVRLLHPPDVVHEAVLDDPFDLVGHRSFTGAIGGRVNMLVWRRNSVDLIGVE